MEERLAQKLKSKFVGGDYYFPVNEGIAMLLQEEKDYPIYRKFRVLLDSGKNKVLVVERYPSIGLIEQTTSSISDEIILTELEDLLDQDLVNAMIFVNK